MPSDSPPPQYSPPRPPPPYDSEIKRQSTIKVSPVPFHPLADIHPQQADPSTLHSVPLDRPTVIVYQALPVAEAQTSAPYLAFCSKCQQEVTTKQTFVTGTFTWILCIIILFFFLPLACVPFCLDSCKDVHHSCPKCSTLLSVKRRFL